MQNIANEIPDAFTDTKRVTKSYILAVNAPCQKWGRPIGAKDSAPRKNKQKNKALEERDLPCEKEGENIKP